MATFSLTYEVWTPEDVEIGDTDQRGFEIEPIAFGFKRATRMTADGFERLRAATRASGHRFGLREAIDIAARHGCRAPSDTSIGAHTWFMDPDGGSECYVTGERTSYSAHFNGCTPSTLRRIARLLEAR